MEGAAAYGDRPPPSSTAPSPHAPADPPSGGSAPVAADDPTGLSPKLSDAPSPEGLSVCARSSELNSSGLQEPVGPVTTPCGAASGATAVGARVPARAEELGHRAPVDEVVGERASGLTAAGESVSHGLAGETRDSAELAAGERVSVGPVAGESVSHGLVGAARDSAETAAGERVLGGAVAGELELGGLTAEEQTDAFLDALALGYQPDATDPALRLLAALRHDLDDQRRSSVSMTPST
ncbi:hypothetical protein HNR40_000499 [Nonomuraea endophytica]|uniref:Uncharacterized protein n=1 Tax=Nonomuraea endophytica TaxID=714136 RepID=A0A7W8ED63_9ACTN|nr:hypothetical protein [Nonomuraea endophytica]